MMMEAWLGIALRYRHVLVVLEGEKASMSPPHLVSTKSLISEAPLADRI